MVQRTASVDRFAGVTSFAEVGCEHHPRLLDGRDVAELAALFDHLPEGRPGCRISARAVVDLAAVEKVRRVAADHIGASAKPVRVLLFDKREGVNWALGWHQDRTIEVRERREVPGFGPWTIKQGRIHVGPPISLLQTMVTARLHVDAVDEGNAPLLVAPRSHRIGLIAEPEIGGIVASLGTVASLADVGDVWLYSTPILHASARADAGRRRRVVQIDICASELPGGLEWSDAA